MGTDIYSFHIYNKNFSPLWTTHIYLVFTIFDIKLYISIRFYSATYYFQSNPLLLSLLNIRLKEMVWHVKDIFECYQKLILLAHISIRRKYLLNRNFRLIYPEIMRDFPSTKQNKYMFCWNNPFLKIYYEKRMSYYFFEKVKYLVISR